MRYQVGSISARRIGASLCILLLGIAALLSARPANAQFRRPRLPNIPKPTFPRLPPIPKPNIGYTGYKTNKPEKMADAERGGWVVAWSDDIAEKDVALGVVAAGVSVYSGNPAAFYAWVQQLVDRTISSLKTSAANRFPAAVRKQITQAAADTIKAAIQGKNEKEVLRRFDTVDFKAGAIKYSGRNYVAGRPVGPPTWGMKPYVAFRIRGSNNDRKPDDTSANAPLDVKRLEALPKDGLKKALEAATREQLAAVIGRLDGPTLKIGLEIIDGATLQVAVDVMDLDTLRAGMQRVDGATLSAILKRLHPAKREKVLPLLDKGTRDAVERRRRDWRE